MGEGSLESSLSNYHTQKKAGTPHTMKVDLRRSRDIDTDSWGLENMMHFFCSLHNTYVNTCIGRDQRRLLQIHLLFNRMYFTGRGSDKVLQIYSGFPTLKNVTLGGFLLPPSVVCNLGL